MFSLSLSQAEQYFSIRGVLVGELMGMGGKIIPRIKLTSAKVLVEVEAELGNFSFFRTGLKMIDSY